MLILSRCPGESIQIGTDITVSITRILEHDGRRTDNVRLGIKAPGHVKILRGGLICSSSEDPASSLPSASPVVRS